MKKLLLLFTFISVNLILSAQMYSRVEIQATPNEYRNLAKLGIPLDDAIFKKTKIIVELESDEILKLKEGGFNYKILIEDIKSFYQNRLATPKIIIRGEKTPEHFHFGSMGGYLTYDEVLVELNDMHTEYPNLISIKAPIDISLPTVNDSLIYWVKISDNPNVDENEPEVLYTGLHHAREPISMMNLIYYMWYLLENYGTDNYATYLVDNFEQYFVPVVNVDGYLYNQQTDPDGGGMWRKNRRNNGDGTYGVDINRNYPFMWGYDDSGSSPYTSEETYRGPSAGSEPSIQNIMEFVANHNFLIANNHHTFSDLLLYPYSYSDTATNPVLSTFVEYASIMSRVNNFTCGRAWEVLYSTNGDANDWMFGEHGVLSFTSETGNDNDGFWPSQDRIIPLCEGDLYMNQMMCTLSGAYAEARDKNPTTIKRFGYFDYNMTFLGLDTTAEFKVFLTGDNILNSDTVTYSNYCRLQTIPDSLFYVVSNDVEYGSQFSIVIVVDNGLLEFTDTVYKLISKIETIYTDNIDDANNWLGYWAITDEAYRSAPYSMTDSPVSDYDNYEDKSTESNLSFDLSQYTNAFVEFYAKWNIEDNWDAVQFFVSTDDGLNWTPLESEGTNPGAGQGVQNSGEPVFDGVQNNWALQSINLLSYLSSSVKFKFVLQSDSYVTYDGFYFDDFVIKSVIDDLSPVIVSQNSIIVHPGIDYSLSFSDINVSDDDNVYPDDFYLFVLPGDNYTVSGLNKIIPDNGYEGTLTVPVQVSDGYKLSNIYYLSVNSTLNISEQKSDIVIFPNPVENHLNIKTSSQIESVEIFSANGILVNKFGKKKLIDVSNLPKGIYTIKIKTNEFVDVKKIIIK